MTEPRTQLGEPHRQESENPEGVREPLRLRTKFTQFILEQTEKRRKEESCNAETYLCESVLVQNTLLELGRLSGRGTQLASLSRGVRRMSGGEGARQSYFGRRHFGLRGVPVTALG